MTLNIPFDKCGWDLGSYQAFWASLCVVSKCNPSWIIAHMTIRTDDPSYGGDANFTLFDLAQKPSQWVFVWESQYFQPSYSAVQYS
jgi:hypothetical protein